MIADGKSGFNTAFLAPEYLGGSGEHTVKLKFVSGNTILVGLAKTFCDTQIDYKPDTVFVRSNGNRVTVDGK